MMSNTATPKYYGIFRARVMAGEIPICKEIAMEMARIDQLIRNENVWYDPAPVEGFIAYCENEMTLTDGSDVKLTDAFKLWGEQLFGWYYFDTKSVPVKDKDGQSRFKRKTVRRRLINKQIIIVGRGAAKTLYDSYVQSYIQNVDPSTTQQITTAPTMKQAEEVMIPINTAILRARGPYMKFLTEPLTLEKANRKVKKVKLESTKIGIVNRLNGSIIQVRPMSIQKLQGLRCKVATIDEFLSCDIREDPIGAIEQGASKVDDYIIVCTSSEGTIRNGVGDNIKMEMMDILRQEYINPHVSIWYYKLDSQEEVGIPALWLKANPNLGTTTSWESYRQDVEKAQKVPSAKNDILAKRFNIPMEGHSYFFTTEEIQPHPKRDYWRMMCSLGIDLSQGDDFCAFTFLFPLSNGQFGVKVLSFITELTFNKLLMATRQKYCEFIQEGSLVVMDGTVLDMMQVYDEVDKYITEHEYTVLTVGYDPYNAREFIERWARENGEVGIEKVQQGVRTESVPLGEIKKMAESRLLLFDQSLMTYSMGNSIVLEDTNGNRKLWKRRHQDKIDNVAALMDALVAFKLNKEGLFE